MIAALLSIAFFAITSCSKTDDRDQFVGDYSLKVTGTLSITMYGQNFSETLNETTSMSIYKAGAESIVTISGYYDCNAFVSGNTIVMDPMSGTQTNNEGLTMQMTITPRRGTLNGNILTFIVDVTGTAYYQGNGYPISGTFYNEAVKR